jgi:hypothetical protein
MDNGVEALVGFVGTHGSMRLNSLSTDCAAYCMVPLIVADQGQKHAGDRSATTTVARLIRRAAL